LSGTNKNWEFSGWQQGYEYVELHSDYDLILFANDSCLNHGIMKLITHKLTNELLLKIYNESLFYGNINRIPDKYGDCLFQNKNLKGWIRTDAFIIPRKILKVISKVDFSNDFNINEIIPKNVTRDSFLQNNHFSKGFTNFLLDWFEKLWHSKFDPFENNLLFRNKTKAIINEKLLSYYIRESNFKTLNNSAI